MSARPIANTLCCLLLAATGAAGASTRAHSLGIKLKDISTDPSMSHMSIVLDSQTIKSGRVALHAENLSKSMVHEVVVVRDDGGKELAFDTKENRVIESKVHRVGEISDLSPGKTGTLKLTLSPGKYLLLCNQPGHFMDGMVARLTVTR
jgi:uncharacterized cupredoxin-like copper-binding protein